MVIDPVLAIVLPTVTVVFLAIIALVMSCCKFKMVTRVQRAYWRYSNAKKSRNGVFTVKTIEDQGTLIANKIYRPGVSKPEPLKPTDTLSTSPLQKDSTCLLGDDVENADTVEEMTSSVEEVISPDRVELSPDENMISSEGPTLDTANIHGDETNYFNGETSDDDNLQTSYYIPMDRPIRGIRKCHTFCGAPSEPYLIRDSVDGESTLLSPQSSSGPELCGPDRSTYITTRPVPVARCSPFRTKEDVERESAMTDRHEKAKTMRPVSVNKSGKFVAQIMPSPIISMPRKVYQCNFDLDASLSDSSDDMFKEAWWRSSLSIDSDSLMKEDTKNPTLHARDPTSRQSSYTGSIYVQMEVETTPAPCRPPPVDGKRGRSLTMPNVFEGRYKDSLSRGMTPQCVSVWYPPHLSGNLQFTAELRPAPRPCFTMPTYVNFKGTLPMKL